MIQVGNSDISESVKFKVADAGVCIIDDGVEIRDFVVIECGDGGYIHIKNGTVINSHTWINASGKVTIGEDVLIGPNVSITSTSHRHTLTKKIKDQGMQVSDVEIGNDVWIGSGCSILAGVSIGESSIIAANAVVKFDIDSACIAAGNPAQYISERKYKTVVFYTLPLVIRDQSTLFSSIVDVYKPLMEKFSAMGWRCILVGTDQLVEEYPDFPFESVSPKTYGMSYQDNVSEDWLDDWTKILTGKELPYHNSFLEKLMSDVDPSLVFCWNYDGILKGICEGLSLPILFNELGLLRPPNPMAYYSDPKGVNTTAGLLDEFREYKSKLKPQSSDYVNYDRLNILENNYQSTQKIKSDSVLVLLQVHDDSNIILGSPFKSMQEYVDCISSALANSNYKIIVKPHPLDESPILNEDVIVEDKHADTTSLIANAAAVFTINSSAGFEAALAGKTVYVLGKSPYSGLGITIDVDSPSMLPKIWGMNKTVLDISRQYRADVINFIYDTYFLDSDAFSQPSAHFTRLIQSKGGTKKGTRKDFITECEVNRQQAYISYLETNNSKLKEGVDYLNLEVEKERNVSRKLNESYDLIKQSISWRITRPLRFFRMLILEPNFTLRKIYHRFPILSPVVSRLRYIKQRLVNFSRNIFNSNDNIAAVQSLSNRRALYQLPKLTTTELPVIAVSIVTYNSEKWVDDFFKSLLQQSYPLDKLNLVLVDNGSSDNTVKTLEEYKNKIGEKFKCFSIISGDNIGFGAGHDTAINASDESLILISNIDLTFTRDALETVVQAATSDISNDVACWELRQAPYEHPKYYDPVTLETNWSSHACILVRREAYQKVKGYDDKIFMYGEDVELSYRFRSFGYHLKYCPKALVFHHTYEHESQVKPLQYRGSTLANFNLRLRYGKWWDKAVIIILQFGLLSRPAPYPSARKDVAKNLLKFVREGKHFRTGKGPSEAVFFPFRMFDYEMIREGAFWPVGTDMSKSPLVTVIVRTYKGRAEYLRQALISICNQTYPCVEIVVVEDGGDTHHDLVQSIASLSNLDISYYHLEKVGRSVTGNHGLEKAKGKYCVFLDDDDLLFADHVEVLVSAIENDNQAVAAYSLAMEIWTKQLNAQGEYSEEFFNTPESFKQEFDYTVLEDHNFIPIQSILFKRQLYIERGGFEEDMDNLEDWNLWLRYGYKNNFIYVPKTTSLFRTPSDPNIREGRHSQLHQAYLVAKERAKKSCEQYIFKENM